MTPHQVNSQPTTVRSRAGEDIRKLDTRLGPVAWRSSGEGPTLVFFAGALANGDLWREVVLALEDRYRCITIDLPLGAHPWPLSTAADRSATSLARLLLDCLELLGLEHATVIANDTAGGLVLLSLATDHPALARVGGLILTNCESYEKFPPKELRPASALSRTFPRLVRELLRLQLRSSIARRRAVSTVVSGELDDDRERSFFGPIRHDRRVADDLVAAMAGFRPQVLIDAARAIPRFDRPMLLIWGEECKFFPMADAQRLASEFPSATLIPVPEAKTWVPIDNPTAVADSIAKLRHPPASRHAPRASRLVQRPTSRSRPLGRPRPCSPRRDWNLPHRLPSGRSYPRPVPPATLAPCSAILCL